jgi:hypothetical protein
MKKKIVLIGVSVAFLATTLNLSSKITVFIDRKYSIDRNAIPFYPTYDGNKTDHYSLTKGKWLNKEDLRLPAQVFVTLTDGSRKEIPRSFNGPDRIERYVSEDLKDPKKIEVSIGGTLVKVDNSPEKNAVVFPITLLDNDLSSLNVIQGLVIRNELKEPLVINYYYENGKIPPFFGEPAFIPDVDSYIRFFSKYILIKSPDYKLEKVTISYLNGTVIKTFTPRDLKSLPHNTENKQLIIRNFLPVTITINNTSDAPLTLKKTSEKYAYSYITKPGPVEDPLRSLINRFDIVIKEKNEIKEESSSIDANKKESYNFQTKNSGKGLKARFSGEGEGKVVFDEVYTVDTVQNISLSSDSSDYCSSPFTLDLQNTTHKFLQKREKPSALTLTIKEASETTDEDENEDEEEEDVFGSFGSSCKKLIFSLTAEALKKK